jgi:hypothetical protein
LGQAVETVVGAGNQGEKARSSRGKEGRGYTFVVTERVWENMKIKGIYGAPYPGDFDFRKCHGLSASPTLHEAVSSISRPVPNTRLRRPARLNSFTHGCLLGVGKILQLGDRTHIRKVHGRFYGKEHRALALAAGLVSKIFVVRKLRARSER